MLTVFGFTGSRKLLMQNQVNLGSREIIRFTRFCINIVKATKQRFPAMYGRVKFSKFSGFLGGKQVYFKI